MSMIQQAKENMETERYDAWAVTKLHLGMFEDNTSGKRVASGS